MPISREIDDLKKAGLMASEQVIKEMNAQEKQTQLANGVDHGHSIHQDRGHDCP